MRKTFPTKLLALLIFLMSGFLKSSAQINADGLQHSVSYSGSFLDLVIPNNPLITKIRFSLSGADGGAAKLNLGESVPGLGFVTAHTYSSGGGNGAVVNGTFLVGSGPGKIPLGSTVRFIIGQKGQTGTDNIGIISNAGTGSEYGGGGGGSAILYRVPGGSTWTLLGVAGGGGGAYQGVVSGVAIGLGDDGGAGEESENGANGGGVDRGTGGIAGNGGGRNVGIVGISPIAAGGGGRFSNGSGLLDYVDVIDITLTPEEIEEAEFGEGGEGKPQGFEYGGYGGNSESLPQYVLDAYAFDFRNGGFGYGGGAAAVGTGGGGGGYSGGGAGGLFNGGGGGGSYLNGIRETGNVSSGGSDTEPDNGIASYEVTLNQPPVAICKNATVYLSATGAASIVVADVDNGSNDPDGTPLTYTLSKSSFTCADIGNNNVTLTVTDIYDATSSCIAVVTVVDNTIPVITCPANVTVSCAANVPAVNTASVIASDNCPVTVTHEGDVITNQTCANRFTLTRTYKATDATGNSATCSHTITVFDNTPPQITGLSVSQQTLWPPNHTMRDITVNYQVNDNCTTPGTSISVSSNEPPNGTGDGDTDTDWEIIDNHHIRLRAERAGNGNGRIYTITITTNDGCNAPVSASTQVIVAHNITGPQTGNPFKIGSTVSLSGVFWDQSGKTHTAKWLVDGSAVANGTVTEPSGNQNGKVTGSYKLNTPGVYKLQMNVTDQTGVTSYANTNNDLDAIVVIYDPNGGYSYGGGWFSSQAGALKSNLSATGKASYGFAVNYTNAAKPKGETQFEFKVGSFEFNALNFDYLAISNSKAQFRGTGKIIGGQSGLGFTMTVTDGALDGTGIDKIRMKIYNKNTGAIFYDNQPGASDADNPVAAVGTNSVIVIQGNQSNASMTKTIAEEVPEAITADGLEITASPNPSNSNFRILVRSNNAQEKIILQVYDVNGKLADVRNSITPGSTVRFGDLYRPGTYFVRVIQGKEHKELKLIKIIE